MLQVGSFLDLKQQQLLIVIYILYMYLLEESYFGKCISFYSNGRKNIDAIKSAHSLSIVLCLKMLPDL